MATNSYYIDPTTGYTGGPASSAQSGVTRIPKYNAQGQIIGYTNLQTASAPNSYNSTPSGNQVGTLLQTPLVNGVPANTLGTTLNLGTGTTSASNTAASNPNANFTLLNQTKNPAIASAASNTLNTENNLASTETKNFNQYLQEAQAALGSQTADVAKDTTTLQNLPGQTAAALNNTNNQFATAAGNANTAYQNLNTGNAATVAGDISQLGTLDQNYVTNSENALALQLAQAGGAINARSINPSGSAGSSSDYNQTVAQTEAQAQIGLQKNLSDMQIQQLQNYTTPLQQTLYQNNVNQTQYGQQLASQIAQMQTGSTEQIAALTQAVAGKSAAEAQSLLSSLGLPLQVTQQVMSTLPQSLNALTGIDQSNNFYGLSSQNANGTINAGGNYIAPNASGGSYTSPNVQTGTQRMGAAQPQTSTQATASNPYLSSVTGATSAPVTGATAAPTTYGTPQYYQQLAQLQNNNLLAQSGYRIDPITGQVINLSDQGQSAGSGTGGAWAGGQYFPAGNDMANNPYAVQ